MAKKDIRQGAGCFVIVFGIIFILSTIGFGLTLVTGGSLSKYFTGAEGESSFGWYKTSFWVFIISIIVLLVAGGKLSNLRLLNKFPYEEENDEKKPE